MKKTIKKIMSVLMTVNMLVFLFACNPVTGNTGKDDNLSYAQITAGSGTSDNGGNTGNDGSTTVTSSGSTDIEVPKFGENTFASKIAGTYSGMDEGDMPFYLSIYNFYGNVYAYGGYTAEEDDSEVYSFWVMEFVPEDPRDFYYDNIDECRIGVTAWSVMSNLGRYWSAPVTGSIKLTEDGITVTGDGDLCPLCTNGKTISLSRRDDLKDYFEDETAVDVSENFYAVNSDENLYGIWKLKDSESPWFVSFEEGERYSEMTVWQKTDGMEASLLTGFFETDDEQKGRAWLNYFMTGSPEIYNFSYSYSGTDLIFDSGFDVFSSGQDAIFERVGINDIPIAMLAEADNTDAINGTLKLNMGEVERDVIPFFTECDDVENNGSEFVRVGDLVFFRYYDPEIYDKEDIYAERGDFNGSYELNKAGCVCYYDLRNGETGLAYRDYCEGPLYYMNGKFYSERFDANEVYSVEYLMSCNPDGSALEAKSDTDTYSVVEAISDKNDCLAIDQFMAGRLYLDYGNMYQSELIMKEGDYVLAIKIAGDSVYAVTTGYSGDSIRLTEYSKYMGGNGIVLAEYDAGDIWKKGYPIIYQIEVYDENIYLGINHCMGVERELVECILIEAESGKENSGSVIFKGMPNNLDKYSDAYFYFNYADDILYTDKNPKGEMALSDEYSGDLIYFDSPYGATLVEKDFIEESLYDVDDGMTAFILQGGAGIRGFFFVKTVNASYNSDYIIGDDRYFELNEFVYTVYDSNLAEKKLEPEL